MAGVLLWVGIGAGLAVIIAVVIYAAMIRRGRAVGNRGLAQRSRLTCPKCGQPFDYDYVIGASFSAVRLGTRRYMACPLCHRWSVFDLYNTVAPRHPPATGGPPGG